MNASCNFLISTSLGLNFFHVNLGRDVVLDVAPVRDGSVLFPAAFILQSVSNEYSWKHLCTNFSRSLSYFGEIVLQQISAPNEIIGQSN